MVSPLMDRPLWLQVANDVSRHPVDIGMAASASAREEEVFSIE